MLRFRVGSLARSSTLPLSSVTYPVIGCSVSALIREKPVTVLNKQRDSSGSTSRAGKGRVMNNLRFPAFKDRNPLPRSLDCALETYDTRSLMQPKLTRNTRYFLLT